MPPSGLFATRWTTQLAMEAMWALLLGIAIGFALALALAVWIVSIAKVLGFFQQQQPTPGVMVRIFPNNASSMIHRTERHSRYSGIAWEAILRFFCHPVCPTAIILAMSRVPVARLRPILSQDGAAASRKLLKYLPGLVWHMSGDK